MRKSMLGVFERELKSSLVGVVKEKDCLGKIGGQNVPSRNVVWSGDQGSMWSDVLLWHWNELVEEEWEIHDPRCL